MKSKKGIALFAVLLMLITGAVRIGGLYSPEKINYKISEVTPGPLSIPNEVTPGPLSIPNEVTPGPLSIPNEVTPGPLSIPNEVTPGPLKINI
ncbi:MAG: hypothetical protein KGZ81_05065 [Flavobacteriales bacterium]|nr:hypothetical protein [Flavobacteriales bacterium]